MALTILLAALAAGMASVDCRSGGGENAPGGPNMPPQTEVLSLAPSESAAADAQEMVLNWQLTPGVDRFVLCKTVPPYGTDCQEHLNVSQATVTVPGPAHDPRATGSWLEYLWLQACDERRCSSPPIAAGVVVHRVAYGTSAWNFIVVARRLEMGQIEISLASASQGPSKTSTLIARAPDGAEIARCENVAPGDWCGPFKGILLSNEIVAEQIYGNLGVTVEFPLMPSTTAADRAAQPTPPRP